MACSKPISEKRFSFADIIQGREASVRVTDDYLFYLVELGMMISGKH
jgi:hypothetical protein